MVPLCFDMEHLFGADGRAFEGVEQMKSHLILKDTVLVDILYASLSHKNVCECDL